MDTSVTQKTIPVTLVHTNANHAQKELTIAKTVPHQDYKHQSVYAQQEPLITVVSVSVATINAKNAKTEKPVSYV